MTQPPISEPPKLTQAEVAQVTQAVSAALHEQGFGNDPHAIIDQPFTFAGKGDFNGSGIKPVFLAGNIASVLFSPQLGILLVPHLTKLVTPGHPPCHYTVHGFAKNPESGLWQLVLDTMRLKRGIEGTLHIPLKGIKRK